MCTDKTNKAYMNTCNYDCDDMNCTYMTHCDESPSLSSNDCLMKDVTVPMFSLFTDVQREMRSLYIITNGY